MPSEWNTEDDFAQVVDRLEGVTLRRRATAATVAISAARHQDDVVQEAEPSDGAALQADAAWQLQMPVGEAAPEVGDVVVDQAGQRWTLLEVHRLPLVGRWKCVARELRVAHGCLDRVDVERAVWDDLGSGPEIVDWIYVSTALPVKIHPEQIVVDETVDPAVTTELFRIVLGESVALEPDDRFVAEDGVVYRLLSLEQAERIDALPVAHVRREATA